MSYLVRILLVVFALSFTQTGLAFSSPIGLAIIPPVQFPTSEFAVTGIRVSALWGHHRDLYGIDIAAGGNITDQDFIGLGVAGLFNNTRGQTTIFPLQLAGLFNYNSNKTSVTGVQIAGGVNYNKGASRVIGFQVAGLANMAPNTKIYGLQVGAYNRALKVVGIQIGLINFAKDLHGIQIGLINFHHNGIFAVSPIINVGF